MSNLVDWAEQGADAFRAFCIVNGYRENVNEGLWDWLEANGFTGTSLCCKIRQAKEADFDFSTFSAGGWTPLALFASSEQGVWYDPSDFSTMFQDSTGTTPVTAVGQPVGLILDKSKGLALGTPIFTEDGVSASDWIYPGTNGGSVAAVSGEIKITCGNPLTALTDRLCYATLSGLVVGVTYKVNSTFRNITDPVGSRLSVSSIIAAGDSTGAYVANLTTSPVSTALYFVATATTMYLRLICMDGGGSATAGLSSATVQSIAGNHATQATAASRPLLQQDGSGKYYLDFDGVDDYLKTDIVDLSAYYATSSFVGANMTGASNTWNIFGLNQDYASVNGAYHMQPTRIVIRDNTTSRTPNYPSAIVIGTPSVLSFVCDFQGTADAVSSRNTVDGTPVSLTSGIAFPNNRAFYIAYSSGPLYFPGRIYSIVSVMKKVSSTDKAETEAYVNSKTGAY